MLGRWLRNRGGRAAGTDLTTRAGRRAARMHLNWIDHGLLRHHWHNFAEVAPGVFRSNHPSHRRLAQYKALGIRSVLNLRGTGTKAPYVLEVESCRKLGLPLTSIAMSARKAPSREALQEMFTAFDTLERPFLMHCKSGADRTGLVAAFYLIDQGTPVAKAKEQLSTRFLHLAQTKTGVLDYVLDQFARRHDETGISLRDWVDREYDAEAAQQGFNAATGRG